MVGLDAAYYSTNDLGTISYSSGTIQSVDGGSLQPFDPMDAYNWTGSATAVDEKKNLIPFINELNQNYPNPFNPSTNISFSVGTYGYTSLRVYDLLGREVATLVNEMKSAGIHSVQWNAANMPSGIYFYRLRAGSYTQTRKLILLR